ncbi:MAG: ATP synthase subunit I [Deltaproteobacteria bacterium]|nr:ATP synthase subunit I [Deltaproteobacteria bacterium]
MNLAQLVPFLTAAGVGAAAGAVFFLGLWWTVRRLPRSPRPGWLTLASLLVRGAAAAAGFALVMQGDWRRLAACLAGFLLARAAVVRAIRPAGQAGERV